MDIHDVKHLSGIRRHESGIRFGYMKYAMYVYRDKRADRYEQQFSKSLKV